MAATEFQNGTIVTPAFLNTIFQASGGHRHTGSDDDGHAPKIVLSAAAEIDGVLPRANQVPPRGYLDGFELTYVVSTNAYNLQFAPGHCCMGNADAVVSTSGTATKKIINDAGTGWVEWSAGNNQGAIPTGVKAIAAGWLYAFVIRKSYDGAVDFGVDSSYTAANLMDASWDQYRRVGAIRIVATDAGKYGIKGFQQFGDLFLWEAYALDYNSVLTDLNTAAGIAVSAPPLSIAHVSLRITPSDDVLYTVQYWDGPLGATINSAKGSQLHQSATIADAAAEQRVSLLTGSSRQIYVAKMAPSGTDPLSLRIFTHGYTDTRGKQ